MSYAEKYFEIYESLNHLGENRAEIALGIFQELCKNDRVSEIKKSWDFRVLRNADISDMIKNGMYFSNIARLNKNSNINSVNESASDKQISYLKMMGVSVREGLSKREASKIIDEIKK